MLTTQHALAGTRRTLAATAVLTLAGLGAVAGPAVAADAANGAAQGKAARPGNNGTVKIAPHGSIDAVPNNTPHVGCQFLVEWYGFDQGDEIVSTVGFAMQAPTGAVGLAVDGPSQVWVGADPGQGAGSQGGLDGREAYTLDFDGAPHPQQGYHVKLTIHTPASRGADTKTKVFWVEGCGTEEPDTETPAEEPETPVEEPETPVEEPETPVEEPETPVEEPETPVEEPETPVEEPETPDDIEVAGDEASTDSPGDGSTDSSSKDATPPAEVEVLGAQAGSGARRSGGAAAPVPTVVDAGVGADVAAPAAEGSPWAPAVAALGALLGFAGLGLRGRRGTAARG